MIATFAMEAGLDPTVMVGGELASIGGTLRIGHSDLFVAESCEYQNSFLQFAPTVGVILNVEMDHPDFFADLEDVIRSFRQFADLVPEDGVLEALEDCLGFEKPSSAIDRCHSLCSLYLPPAAVASLPSVCTGVSNMPPAYCI